MTGMTSHPDSQICKCLVWAEAANSTRAKWQMVISTQWFACTQAVWQRCCLRGNPARNHFIPVMESNYALPARGGYNVSKGSALIGPRGPNDDVGTSDVISWVYSNEPVKLFDSFYLKMDVPRLLNSLFFLLLPSTLLLTLVDERALRTAPLVKVRKDKTTKHCGDNCHAKVSFPQIALSICRIWYLKSCR